ncbi:MAG: hypothetical protein L0Z68_00640 [Gammaproteobacteria bacterium]|nr:hypothetical protein [Gammaproteobacteria bacterium]
MASEKNLSYYSTGFLCRLRDAAIGSSEAEERRTGESQERRTGEAERRRRY